MSSWWVLALPHLIWRYVRFEKVPCVCGRTTINDLNSNAVANSTDMCPLVDTFVGNFVAYPAIGSWTARTYVVGPWLVPRDTNRYVDLTSASTTRYVRRNIASSGTISALCSYKEFTLAQAWPIFRGFNERHARFRSSNSTCLRWKVIERRYTSIASSSGAKTRLRSSCEACQGEEK